MEFLYCRERSRRSFEGANPRHAHEWEVWRRVTLPDDKVIMPGVLDTSTNYVEHPELVAQRICRYADAVGRERVIASSDCGFELVTSRTFQVFQSEPASATPSFWAGSPRFKK